MDNNVTDVEKLRLENEALKARMTEKDNFIDRIQGENAGLRTDLEKRITFEDLLSKLAERTPTSNHEDHVQNVPENSGERNENPKFSKEDMEQLVVQKLKEQSERAVAEQNISRVRNELRDLVGADYQAKLLEVGTKYGMDETAIGAMAARAPQALLDLFKANYQPEKKEGDDFLSVPASKQVNSLSQKKLPPNLKPKSYYTNLRKTNPVEYWKPKTLNEMHEMATQFGPEFFDN